MNVVQMHGEIELRDNMTRSLEAIAKNTELTAQNIDRVLKQTASRAQTHLNATSEKFSKFGRDMARVGQSMSLGISLPLALAGKQAVDSAARFDTLTRGMTAVMGSASAAKAEIEKLRIVALQPGIGFEQAIKASQRLQAVGISADGARKAIEQFAKMNARAGGSVDDLSEVVRQYTQIIGLGKVTAENINVIKERIPEISKVMKEAFGTSSGEVIQKAMKDGTLTMDAFVHGMTQGMQGFGAVKGGIQNELDNLKDNVNQMMASVGNAIIPTLVLVLNELEPIIKKVTEWFKGLDDDSKKTFVKVALAIGLLGPSLVITGKLVDGFAKSWRLLGLAYDLVMGKKIAAAVTDVGSAAVTATGRVGGLRGALLALGNGSVLAGIGTLSLALAGIVGYLALIKAGVENDFGADGKTMTPGMRKFAQGFESHRAGRPGGAIVPQVVPSFPMLKDPQQVPGFGKLFKQENSTLADSLRAATGRAATGPEGFFPQKVIGGLQVTPTPAKTKEELAWEAQLATLKSKIGSYANGSGDGGGGRGGGGGISEAVEARKELIATLKSEREALRLVGSETDSERMKDRLYYTDKLAFGKLSDAQIKSMIVETVGSREARAAELAVQKQYQQSVKGLKLDTDKLNATTELQRSLLEFKASDLYPKLLAQDAKDKGNRVETVQNLITENANRKESLQLLDIENAKRKQLASTMEGIRVGIQYEIAMLKARNEEEKLNVEMQLGKYRTLGPMAQAFIRVWEKSLAGARAESDLLSSVGKSVSDAMEDELKAIAKVQEAYEASDKGGRDAYAGYVKDLTLKLLELSKGLDAVAEAKVRESLAGVNDEKERENMVQKVLGLQRYISALADQKEKIADLAKGLSDVFGQAIKDVASGMNNLWDGILQGMVAMLQEMALQWVKSQAFNLFTNLLGGGGGGGGLPGAFQSNTPGIFSGAGAAAAAVPGTTINNVVQNISVRDAQSFIPNAKEIAGKSLNGIQAGQRR